jgi:aerobic-type carbon monoxide dehydrogenase small subunit (CoxS/CutS family)
MKDDSKPRRLTRRNFIKGVGTGVVGTYAITPGIEKISKKIIDETPDDIEGKQLLNLKVNGKTIKTKVEARTTLAELLRDKLNLTGTKLVCNQGECGSCTVLLDGKAVYSCHLLALDADGKEVTTIEGLLNGEKLNPIQEAFIEHDGLQCGYCTPGQIMAAQGLLNKIPNPNKEQILDGMSGNICRCSAYPSIIKSVIAAAEKI